MQGNTANFTVQFLSSTGAATTPSSGNLTVTYKSGGVSITATIGLTNNSGLFTGAWDTTPADLGLATWVVSSPLSSAPAQTDTIDVIDP